MVARLQTAKTIGVIAHYKFQAPAFWGFDSIDLTDGTKKFPGFLSTCRSKAK
jgi:hypothetical protein